MHDLTLMLIIQEKDLRMLRYEHHFLSREIQTIVCRYLVFTKLKSSAYTSEDRMRIEELFGKVLKEKRNQIGLSQEALATKSGFHRTYISLLERGLKSPSLSTMNKLAYSLEIKLSLLLTLVEEKSSEGEISENN